MEIIQWKSGVCSCPVVFSVHLVNGKPFIPKGATLESLSTTLDLRVCVIKKGNFLYQSLGEEAVLLNLDNEQYYGLDAIGVRLWQLLDEGSEVNAIIGRILAEYDVEEEVLRRDLATFIDELQRAGLVSVEPQSK